jgi:cholesterol 7alpha-monooxygenase
MIITLIVFSLLIVYISLLLLFNGRRRKGEPPLITGYIPYLGVIFDYGAHPAQYLFSLRKKFGDIFTIVLAGKRITYVTHPLDYQKVYASSKQLSFEEIGSEVAIHAFGCSMEVCTDRNIQTEVSRHFVKYLQSPEAIADLTYRMQEKLEHYLSIDSSELKEWKTEGLMSFVTRVIARASIDALFGTDFYSDKVLQDVKDFDETLHLNIAGIPKWFIKKSIQAREDLAKLFLKDYDNVSDFITARNELLKENASHSDLIHGQATILWASQVNTYPATFWVIAQILKLPKSIRQEIIEEIDQYIFDDNTTMEPNGLHLPIITREKLDKMVKLDSCINESLRLCAYNISARMVLKDMTFVSHTGQKYKLRKDDNIHILTCATHRDEDIYPNASEFQYDRFLKQPTTVLKDGKQVPNNMLLLPFGNGISYCPGRFFARNEIKLCAAMFLYFYDIQFADPEQDLPPFNFARFGLSLLPPQNDIQVKYKLKDKYI